MKKEYTKTQIRALQVWAVLVYAASKSQTITYPELSRATGVVPNGFTRILGLLQDYCEDKKLPPLTALVVSKDTGKPKDGCDVPAEQLPKKWQEIFQHPWKRKEAPELKDLGAE